MLPDNDRLNYLFRSYLQDNASGEELEELFSYIRQAEQHALLQEQIKEVYRQIEVDNSIERAKVDWDAMFYSIINRREAEGAESKKAIKQLYIWRSVAAAVLVLILGGLGVYLYNIQAPSLQVVAQSQSIKNDISPGGNKARLTLSNGTTITLDSANNGQLANQGKVNVVKVEGGQLAYNLQSKIKNPHQEIQYNTLTVPRGGQYQLILSDSTKVWLNAASSIRYPTAFIGKERKVEISGEAYFEVVHNEKMPFKVQAGNEVVEDLGTHFNINAYSDQPLIKTTLLEGSVKIAHTLLQPGEQAVMNKNGQIHVVKDIDVKDVIAWKNGFFSFKNDDLQSVMQKLSRWYDVEVVYQQGVNINNEQQFSGQIDRSLTLSQVLNGLKQTKAHFRIEANRKVVILP